MKQKAPNLRELRPVLDEAYETYHKPVFIQDDPISIPHLFTKKEDIEIAGFYAAIFSWGQRKTIIAKSKELLSMMENKPHEFLIGASANDLKAFCHFKHRTFNADDFYAIHHGLKMIYREHGGLEKVIGQGFKTQDAWHGLISLNKIIFSYDHLPRTRKHISNPETGSACKRLHMFLRWMVRKDTKGIDFGLWKDIPPAQLLCPLDVHVANTARKMGLLHRKQNDRKAVDELTDTLKTLDPDDPAKYDYALFGLSRYPSGIIL